MSEQCVVEFSRLFFCVCACLRRNVHLLGDVCASQPDWDTSRHGTHGSGRLKPAHSQPAPWRGRIQSAVLSKSLSAKAARGPKFTNDYIIVENTHIHMHKHIHTGAHGTGLN